MVSARDIIAKNIALMFKDGDVVNLGIGMPTLVANYIPDEMTIYLHGENGVVGLGPPPEPDQEDKDLINAGGNPTSIITGGACFDSAISFAIIRGGHLTATVLGALEVDEKGNLANWMIPGKLVPGMGGAMDLVAGARMVIIAMEHTTKDGAPRILKDCTLPLTAVGEVDLIVTELGIMKVTSQGILLKALAPGVSLEEIQNKTDATLLIPEEIETMIT